MFYDVKILRADGKIRKVIPAVELRRRHWEKFQMDLLPGERMSAMRKKAAGGIKKA
jgi:hypothetical protein